MFWRIDNKMDRISDDNIVDYIEDVFRRRGAESYLGEQSYNGSTYATNCTMC